MKPKRPNPPFPGFSIPQGAFIPPEIQDVLPDIHLLSELKVLFAALFDACQPGRAGMPLSITALMKLTGMTRQSVIRGRTACVERGTFFTWQEAGTQIYALHLKFGEGGVMVIPPVVVTTTPTTTPTTELLTDDHSQLRDRMLRVGVSPGSARHILRRYSTARIEQVVGHVEHILHSQPGRLTSPGGFVCAALKHQWVVVPPYRQERDAEHDEMRAALRSRNREMDRCLTEAERHGVSPAAAMNCFSGRCDDELPCDETCPLRA